MFENFGERIKHMGYASRDIMENPVKLMKYIFVCWLGGIVLGAIQIYRETKEYV